MENTAVIYKSKHGSTGIYAGWIGEALDCIIMHAEDVRPKDLDSFDNIIYGGCVHAGGIMGLDLISKNMRRLEGKKVVVFAVGLNVMEKESRMQLREINFSKKKMRGITCYYCPGAYDPGEVKGLDAAIINMMVKMLKGKPEDELTENDRRLLKAVLEGTDMVDKKYIEPIVKEFLT